MYQFQITPNSEVMTSRNGTDMTGPTKSILPASSRKLSPVLSYILAAVNTVSGT